MKLLEHILCPIYEIVAYRQQPLVYLGGLRRGYGYSELVKELPEAADLHLRHSDLPLFKALPVG